MRAARGIQLIFRLKSVDQWIVALKSADKGLIIINWSTNFQELRESGSFGDSRRSTWLSFIVSLNLKRIKERIQKNPKNPKNFAHPAHANA